MIKKTFLSLYTSLLGYCARRVIHRTHPYIIGVTGSVGKTTARLIVTQTIQQLLPHVHILTSPKNFNGDMGFSLSILGIESFTPSLGGYLCGMGQAIWSVVFAPHYDIMVLEYGIDYPGEMDKLLSIAVPDIGIITRIDAVHSQQMGDPTHIAEQKRKMIDASKDIVFLNMDDVYIKQMDDRTDADILWYSIIDGALGDIGYTHATLQTSEVSLLMTEVELFTGDRNWIGSVNILSKALVSYVAIGMSIVSVIAYRRQEKTQELNHLSYHLQPGRLSLFQ
ncbi:MAG: hypothetical protein H6766_01905 [Candidatus Peribacteria bacterium]|nr:MAG: hypothetical protein H6766_01905 [Candidatus Peribacteria bacterium]